ncbi:MAG: response regulator [Pseudomonadota bacterium]
MPEIRILVLDDEPIVCKRLKPALEKCGYRVDLAATGQEAIERLDEERYSIVITDVRMEGIDGLEVLKHARERSPTTIVIMITGYATVEVARQALTLGAFDFIAKPFKIDDLRAVVARAVSKLEAAPAR